jgi:AcrR family transcriptional regulator
MLTNNDVRANLGRTMAPHDSTAARTVRSGLPAPTRRPRRKRDPQGTREAILEAGLEMLAKDGKEGLSVAQVAQRAGVNRGTAYQHFQTREQLIEATTAWVSENLYRAVFEDPKIGNLTPVERSTNALTLTEHIVGFAMENPELGRAWLFELLSSQRPAGDKFWREYESGFQKYAETEFAQPGIDTEVASVVVLTASFLWPVWVRAHARSAKERQQMGKRFTRELLRFCLHGSMRPEKYPQLDALVSKEVGGGSG